MVLQSKQNKIKRYHILKHSLDLKGDNMACIVLVGRTWDLDLVFSLVWHNLIKTRHKPSYRTADTDNSGLKLGHMKQAARPLNSVAFIHSANTFTSQHGQKTIQWTHITASEATINNKMIQVTDKLVKCEFRKEWCIRLATNDTEVTCSIADTCFITCPTCCREQFCKRDTARRKLCREINKKIKDLVLGLDIYFYSWPTGYFVCSCMCSIYS